MLFHLQTCLRSYIAVPTWLGAQELQSGWSKLRIFKTILFGLVFQRKGAHRCHKGDISWHQASTYQTCWLPFQSRTLLATGMPGLLFTHDRSISVHRFWLDCWTSLQVWRELGHSRLILPRVFCGRESLNESGLCHDNAWAQDKFAQVVSWLARLWVCRDFHYRFLSWTISLGRRLKFTNSYNQHVKMSDQITYL